MSLFPCFHGCATYVISFHDLWLCYEVNISVILSCIMNADVCVFGS